MSPVKILHVDDEPDIRELVELSLSLSPDLDVKSCTSGAEALSLAAEWAPDVILLDVMMPLMDGPQTLERLRANPGTAKIPVFFMTARVQPHEIEQFHSLGAAGVIPKPFDPVTLSEAVKDCVAQLNNAGS